MLHDPLKHAWAPFGRVSWYPEVLISSALFVAMWGYFLHHGVVDRLGGINSLWPFVQDCEPGARRRSVVRRHDRDRADGEVALCVGDDRAAGVAVRDHADGAVAEDLLDRSADGVPGYKSAREYIRARFPAGYSAPH